MPTNAAASNYVLVVHGGAGTMSKEGSTPEQRQASKIALGEALRAGYVILKEGGEAMDAAVAAVVSLEDNPLFNAGKGAVFNTAGKNPSKLARAIYLAAPREGDPSRSTVSEDHVPGSSSGEGEQVPPATFDINDDTPPSIPHPFLSGPYADSDSFANQLAGIELVDPAYFFTERRWRGTSSRIGITCRTTPRPSPFNFNIS
ncbi:nucleophile aminohydrolase [Coprinopsis sp. MPI-PUGE-AT-0042]|nr:nucleophile aminohydrolase [Coprinopsis sp. MPI-PUGE-AT-0042]